MLEFKGLPKEVSDMLDSRYASRSKTEYFNLTPRILPAGKESRIQIKSKDENISLEGKFLLAVFPYYEYDYRPFIDNFCDLCEIEAKDGIVEFDYFFGSEEKYIIIVGQQSEEGLNILLRSAVYALDDDLYSLMPLMGDFHSHTFYSDGFESPESVLHAAVDCGLDFIAITDHNNYQGSAVAVEVCESKNIPITVINGEEFSSTFTNMHVISLGAPQPLDEKYYLQHPNEENTSVSVADLTKELCRHINENGGLSVMCHPLWKPVRRDRKRFDVPHSLVKELMESDVFDAIEVVGGSPIEDSMTSPMQYQWAMSYGATPDKVAYLGSTDSHTYSIDPICGKHFTLVFAEDRTQSAIVDAVRMKRTVAVQIIDGHNALCFGIPRYAMFAEFYLREVAKRIS